jgi:hypothetical protein
VGKIGEIAAAAADIIRRYTGGETNTEIASGALTKLQKERADLESTIAKVEGSSFGSTAQGAKSVAQAKQRIDLIDEQVRHMNRLNASAVSAAAAVKAATIDGTDTDGNRPAAGSGSPDRPKKASRTKTEKDPRHTAEQIRQKQLDGRQEYIDDQVAIDKQAAEFRKQEEDDLKRMAEERRRYNEQLTQTADRYRAYIDPTFVIAERLKEISDLEAQGALTATEAGKAREQLQLQHLEDLGLNLEATSTMASLQTEQWRVMYERIDEMRQQDLINEQTASALKAQVAAQQQAAQLNSYSSFFGQMATLQTSYSKKAAKVGKAAAIAQTTIETYKSATSAYSAMAGIPYVGPALGIAAAAAAIAAGLANVRAIQSSPTGFSSGGYTGNMGVKEVAGVVHGKEYVINAKATKKHRGLLEAINRGYESGGYVQPLSQGASLHSRSGPSRGVTLGQSAQINNNISISVGSVDSMDRTNELLRTVRETVEIQTKKTMADQLRKGGMLNPVR